MDTEIEIELEVRIQEEIDKILASLDLGKEGTAPPESLDGTIGRLNRQDALMQQEMAKNFERRRSTRLRLLQEAAQRIVDGTYGECLNCGAEIATPRLLESPEATLCSACA